MLHAQRLEHVTTHVREERLARRTLHHGADEIESVRRVREARAGRGYERVILEDAESGGDVREWLVERELIALVVAYAGQVPAQESSRDRRALVRKRGDVALHGRGEVQFAGFVQLRNGIGRQRFRHAAYSELGLGRRASLRL